MVTTWRITMLFIKLIVLTCFSIQTTYANKIDSLSARADVLKFLEDNFKEQGVLSTHRCIGNSSTKRLNIYFSIPDTIFVEDPITRELHAKTVPKDTSQLRNKDILRFPLHLPLENIMWAFKEKAWQIHKADIDGNGYTDMVINFDTAGVIVVMDTKKGYEAHILNDSYDFTSYTFMNFMPLPDGTKALILRHNPCTLENQTAARKIITYITDSNTDMPLKDTLYKVITVIDSIYLWRSDTPYYSHRWVNSDTVDMKRYSMMDTVVFKFNGFAKYNSHLSAAAISKIGYYFYADYEECMEIQSDGKCFLRYPDYDTTFSAQLDIKRLDELWDFAAYLGVQPGKYEECGSFSGLSRGAFIIYFSDGTKRELVFGTKTPPMGLGYLGLKLSEISFDLDWQPSAKCKGPGCPCPKLDTSKWKYTVDCECRSIDMVECY